MARSGSRVRPGQAWAIVAAVLATAIALGGCSAGSGGGAAGSVASPATADQAGEPALPQAGKVDAGAAAPPGTVDLRAPAVAGPRLIRTADIAVRVDDLAVAAGRVRAVAVGLGGTIASETTGFREPAELKPADATPDAKPQAAAQGESLLVVRVPEARLQTAIDQVAAIGVELSRTSTSQDVTGDIADVSSRLATQRASVARVRALLARASKLQDVVLLESEMSKRESDLEALEARLASLTDQADLATLSVTLRTPPAAAAAQHNDRGFVAGLHNGWRAIGASTNIVLTVLGALLPVALVLALLGAPVLLVVRRRRSRGHAPATS